jgi:hypothetical protein
MRDLLESNRKSSTAGKLESWKAGKLESQRAESQDPSVD